MPEGLNFLLQKFRLACHAAETQAYLNKLLDLSPRGSHICELVAASHFGTQLHCGGFASLWMGQRGVSLEIICDSIVAIEQLREVGSTLGVKLAFAMQSVVDLCDPERLSSTTPPRYNLLHHANLLHQFEVPWIHAQLAQQVALAERVVFTVPSMYAPPLWEWGRPRLLPLEEWERILAPIEVEELAYHGKSEDLGVSFR